MDQEKFQSVTYVQGESQVMLEANKPQFKQMTTVGSRRILRSEKSKREIGHQSTH
jgi:hypothetical protein